MIKIKQQLNLKNIHNKVSQEAIWTHITGKDISKPFKLRREGLASCTLRVGNRGDLIMRDWGDPSNMIAETWWRYLIRTKYTNDVHGYLCALEEIRSAFGLEDIIKYSKVTTTFPKADIFNVPKIESSNDRVELKIKVKRKGNCIYYSNKDLSFWQEYGISKKKLQEKLVFPINIFWINSIQINVKDKLAFAYLHGERDGLEEISIYLPLEKRRWIKNTSSRLIQNIDNIDTKGELLTIQTSLKDIMCMEELGYRNIIAPNSENVVFSKDIWTPLTERFDKQIYFANNDWMKEDNPGLGYAKIWNSTYGIDYIYTPDNTSSDISDYRQKYGEYETKLLLTKLYGEL